VAVSEEGLQRLQKRLLVLGRHTLPAKHPETALFLLNQGLIQVGAAHIDGEEGSVWGIGVHKDEFQEVREGSDKAFAFSGGFRKKSPAIFSLDSHGAGGEPLRDFFVTGFIRRVCPFWHIWHPRLPRVVFWVVL